MNSIRIGLRNGFIALTVFVALQSLYMPEIAPWGITSGVTIPANQEFVLGEFNHPNYRSVITNKSVVDVEVELRDRFSKTIVRQLDLAAGGSVKVNVSRTEMVVLKNQTASSVLIKVKASRNVQGMRYQQLDAYEG